MMLQAGTTTLIICAWSSPILIATKIDGKSRFWVDYPTLNQKMKANRFPLPWIQKNSDELAGTAVFATPDLFPGYCKIKFSESHKEKTTVQSGFGIFQFELIPSGLMNAPSAF